jgi:hypothetical protein
METEKIMETKKILLWWLLYNVMGVMAAAGIGFIGGIFAGFFGDIFNLPDSFEGLFAIPVFICVCTSNFFIFKWSVNKILD